MVLPTVLIPRPEPHATRAVEHLRLAGVSAVSLPVLEILPLAFEPILPERMDVVVFVSSFAFTHYWAHVQKEYPGYSWPINTAIAVVGKGTMQTVRSSLNSDSLEILYPSEHDAPDSEHLWLQLKDRSIKNSLIVRGESGREWLAQRLREIGATVFFCTPYQRKSVQWNTNQVRILRERWAQSSPTIWWLTSSEILLAAYKNVQQIEAEGAWWQSHFWVVHPRIQETLHQIAEQVTQQGATRQGIQQYSPFCHICPPTIEDFRKRLLEFYA